MSIHISCHNPNFGTAGQIEPSDVDQIAKQGYKSIINNRPDGEEGRDHRCGDKEGRAGHLALKDHPQGRQRAGQIHDQ